MEDSEIQRIANNSTEWRIYILKGQNKLFKLVADQNARIIKIETHQKIWRLAGVGVLGSLLVWVQSHFK